VGIKSARKWEPSVASWYNHSFPLLILSNSTNQVMDSLEWFNQLLVKQYSARGGASPVHCCQMTAMISWDFHCKLMLIRELKPWRSTYDISGILAGSATGCDGHKPEARVCESAYRREAGHQYIKSRLEIVADGRCGGRWEKKSNVNIGQERNTCKRL